MTRRERFHLLRLLVWAVQVPIALSTGLKNNVPYVVFLSVAALIESALTDFDQAHTARKNAQSAKSADHGGVTVPLAPDCEYARSHRLAATHTGIPGLRILCVHDEGPTAGEDDGDAGHPDGPVRGGED